MARDVVQLLSSYVQSNLYIGTGATVSKVIIEDNKAVGVSYIQEPNNVEGSVRAKQEVIRWIYWFSIHFNAIRNRTFIEISVETKVCFPVGKTCTIVHILIYLTFAVTSDSNRYDKSISLYSRIMYWEQAHIQAVKFKPWHCSSIRKDLSHPDFHLHFNGAVSTTGSQCTSTCGGVWRSGRTRLWNIANSTTA